MDTTELAFDIDTELRAGGSSERAERERAYLKSDLEHYGVPVQAIRAVAKAVVRRAPGLSHDELVELAATLWSSSVHEDRMAAVELLIQAGDSLEPDDFALVEAMLRDSHTWAFVDNLAASVIGPLVGRRPELLCNLDRFAADDNFWIRRSSLLALLPELRAGAGDFPRFCRYADAMLDEREFFIAKAIGWVLRDMGRKRPALVYDFLLPRAGRVASVTLREALKPLTAEQRAAIASARSTK